MRLRRVPYEWILAAMFVGSFFLGAADTYVGVEAFVGRGIWLLIIGPAAGLSLGVRRTPSDPKPRFGPVTLAAASAWFYVCVLTAVISLGLRDHSDDLWILFCFAPTAAGASFLALVSAASRPGEYREVGVFGNAAFLLVFAFGLDAILTPKA